jgi:hypothetical protein
MEGMKALEERLRTHLDENVASLWPEKWLRIHVGGHPTVYFDLYRLLRMRHSELHKDVTSVTRRGPRRVCLRGVLCVFSPVRGEGVEVYGETVA